MTKKKPKTSSSTIAQNKRARFDYHIGDRFEAGIVLAGWEVKSLRAGKATLTDTYVLLKDGEAFLLGVHITPLNTASTHYVTDPDRTRKLLLHKKEISRLFNATTQKGHTCVPLSLYWKGNKVKCSIALASGKKQQDKRATIKEREWNRDKSRVLKAHNN
jgi:SsrA-binding protein